MASAARIVAIVVTIFSAPFLLIGLAIGGLSISSLTAAGSRSGAWVVASVGLTFTVAGALAIFAAWRGVFVARRQEALAATHSPEQWLSNPEWASHRIKDLGTGRGRIHSLLVLDTVPAPIGGVLRGNIEVDAGMQDFHGVQAINVTLSKLLQQADEHRRRVEHAYWQETKQLPVSALRSRAGGVSIPVEFNIPADAEQSNEIKLNGCVVWRVNVEADTQRGKLTAGFDVPVFRTAASPVVQKLPIAKYVALPEFERPRDPARAAAPPLVRKIALKETAHGLELSFPPFRHRMMAIMMLAFTLIFGTALIAVMYGKPSFLAFVVLSAVVAFTGYSALDALFFSSSVVVGKRSLQVTHRLIVGSRKTIPSTAIAAVKLRQAGAYGTGARDRAERMYYTLAVRTRDGKETILGKYVDQNEGEWLAEQIRNRLPGETHNMG